MLTFHYGLRNPILWNTLLVLVFIMITTMLNETAEHTASEEHDSASSVTESIGAGIVLNCCSCTGSVIGHSR